MVPYVVDSFKKKNSGLALLSYKEDLIWSQKNFTLKDTLFIKKHTMDYRVLTLLKVRKIVCCT